MFMIFRAIFLFFFLTTVGQANAQKRDSIFVGKGKSGWIVPYKVKNGDNIFSIARHYHVPPAMLADLNKVRYQDAMKENSYVIVPLAAFNFIVKNPSNPDETRPVYYRVLPEEDLGKIAKLSNVPRRYVREWNNMQAEEVTPGQVVQVGWVMYDATEIAPPVPEPTPTTRPPGTPPGQGRMKVKPIIDSPKYVKKVIVDTFTTTEKLYLKQTQNEENISTEKGGAVFFNIPVKAVREVYFAFYSGAPKGTIMRVVNPGTGKSVYVKVQGALPTTKQYFNSIIGISDKAKEDLGVVEEKAWVELTYAGK